MTSRNIVTHSDVRSFEWSVAEEYLLARELDSHQECIKRSSDAELRRYAPRDERALVSEFARVMRPVLRGRVAEHTDTRSVALMAFVQDFGLLGHWRRHQGTPDTVANTTVASSEFHDTKRRFAGTDDKEILAEADEIAWALAHAENVDLCLRLAAALQQAGSKNLKGLVEPLLARNRADGTCVADPVSVRYPQFEMIENYKDKPDQAAYWLLDALIDPVIRTVRTKMGPSGPDFAVTSLLQAIYVQLACWVRGEQSLRECKACGTFFQADDARQKFCPPPSWIPESRCSVRVRMRMRRTTKQ